MEDLQNVERRVTMSCSCGQWRGPMMRREWPSGRQGQDVAPPDALAQVWERLVAQREMFTEAFSLQQHVITALLAQQKQLLTLINPATFTSHTHREHPNQAPIRTVGEDSHMARDRPCGGGDGGRSEGRICYKRSEASDSHRPVSARNSGDTIAAILADTLLPSVPTNHCQSIATSARGGSPHAKPINKTMWKMVCMCLSGYALRWSGQPTFSRMYIAAKPRRAHLRSQSCCEWMQRRRVQSCVQAKVTSRVCGGASWRLWWATHRRPSRNSIGSAHRLQLVREPISCLAQRPWTLVAAKVHCVLRRTRASEVCHCGLNSNLSN